MTFKSVSRATTSSISHSNNFPQVYQDGSHENERSAAWSPWYYGIAVSTRAETGDRFTIVRSFRVELAVLIARGNFEKAIFPVIEENH